MRIIQLFLFTLLPTFLFSQIEVTGRVLDKETLEPVPNVFVYAGEGSQMSLTDDNGSYRLILYPTDTVYFKHIAYRFFSTRTDTLLSHTDVYLLRDPLELTEITVHPQNAESLLYRAIQNLHIRFQTKEMIPYLVYCEEKTSKGDEREVYALVTAFLKGINKRRGTFDWNFELSQLDRIKTCSESNFYIKKKPIFVELFVRKIVNKKSRSDNSVLEMQDTDENQFVIKVSPKRLNKKNYFYNLFTINKQDTTLVEVVGQSYINVSELTSMNIKDVNWQITNHFAKVTFTKDEKTDLYCLKDEIMLGNCKVTSIDNSYDLSFKTTTSAVGKSRIPQHPPKKKIKPYNYELFEADFPNTPGFWKQHINP